jgi:hypothetical protein
MFSDRPTTDESGSSLGSGAPERPSRIPFCKISAPRKNRLKDRRFVRLRQKKAQCNCRGRSLTTIVQYFLLLLAKHVFHDSLRSVFVKAADL